MKLIGSLLAIVFIGGAVAVGQEVDTLALLAGGQAPRNFDEMWARFDPRAEPHEVDRYRCKV